MKKALLILFSCLLLLAVACSEVEPEPSRFKPGSLELTAENLPRICATPYTKAMAVNMVTAALGCDAATAEASVTVCDNTDDCYEKLMKSQCDIIIAHDYGKDITALLDSTELGIVSTELDRDALVFFTNGSHGVESVTLEQLKSIYNGEVIDWKQLEGAEQAITLFGQRARTATQNAFQRHISAEAEISPVTRPIISSGVTYNAEVSYDNRNGGLGYNLLSLSGDFSGGSIKPLKINNVAPSKETVASGEYAFTVGVNLVIRDSEKSDSNTKLLYDWAISEQGKTAIGKLY